MAIGNGGIITIKGGVNSLVIINVSGTLNINDNVANSGIILSGGITADQIIWNLTSTGNNAWSSSGAVATNVLQGDFLDLAGNFNLNNITVDGRIFGGDSDGVHRSTVTTDQIVSGESINAPPTNIGSVPEPSAWMLSLLDAGIIGFVKFRKSRTA